MVKPPSASSRFLALILGVSLALVASRAHAQEAPRVPGELAIESRLLAPCCWTQTLDTHESELTTALREEIRTRLRAGESPASIEDRFVARYGERIRAVPRESDPRGLALGVAAVVMALAALVVARSLRRWSRPRTTEAPAAPSAKRERDAYDDQIDAEVHALDGE